MLTAVEVIAETLVLWVVKIAVVERVLEDVHLVVLAIAKVIALEHVGVLVA